MGEAKPVKYEASNVFLKKIMRPEIVEEFNKILENFDVAVIFLVSPKDKAMTPVLLSHTSHENAEQGIIELEYHEDPKKAEQIIKALASLAGA
jgi:hypothetical protein